MQFSIRGFPVSFPHQPYGVQFSFMEKMLRTLDESGNALLEAPTGCGKTLSLLCAALAWRETKARQRAARSMHRTERLLQKSRHSGGEQRTSIDGADGGGCGGEDEDDAHQPGGRTEQDQDEEEEEEEEKLPKIFFATRTHSQIAQVVRELKRTQYRPKMAVLAAKQHYCINKAVIKTGRIDEECERLVKEDSFGCRFHRGRGKGPRVSVQVHDIEDLAKACASAKVCPYYTARDMALTADLIFCPYSYLLDPVVRASLDLDVKDSILIFDEAHNMEDVCREGGSLDLDLDLLRDVYQALATAAQMSARKELYAPLAEAVQRIISWLQGYEQSTEGMTPSGYEQHEAVSQGATALALLDGAGLGPERVAELWHAYQQAKKSEEKATFDTEGEAANEPIPEGVTRAGAGGLAMGTLGRLLTVLGLMYALVDAAPPGPPGNMPPGAPGRPQRDNSGDYRLIVRRWIAHANKDRRKGGRGRRPAEEEEGAAPGASAAVQLGLWCLNPAVAFRGLAAAAHSVILTSGTLSPLDSFASELGTAFHVRLEAPHVVDMQRQVWAGVVPRCPTGQLLSATFKETDTFAFQDGSGAAVLRLCQTIPDGVLLFTPSYVLLDKLSARWKATGLWAQLSSTKVVVVEGRDGGKGFEEAMTKYYAAVKAGRGALFMAVCRGKASEGIDFADQHARGVILLGIPFPAAKDTKVRLKKTYNDANCGPSRAPTERVLSGDSWYTQQAFRALNQAVGRCIRHKYDYGAIILLDERFRRPNNQKQLSRWVRGAIQVHDEFETSITALTAFFKGLEADPPKAPQPAQVQAPLPSQLQLQPSDTALQGEGASTASTAAPSKVWAPYAKLAARAGATTAAPPAAAMSATGIEALAAAAAARNAAAVAARAAAKGIELQYEEGVAYPEAAPHGSFVEPQCAQRAADTQAGAYGGAATQLHVPSDTMRGSGAGGCSSSGAPLSSGGGRSGEWSRGGYGGAALPGGDLGANVFAGFRKGGALKGKVPSEPAGQAAGPPPHPYPHMPYARGAFSPSPGADPARQPFTAALMQPAPLAAAPEVTPALTQAYPQHRGSGGATQQQLQSHGSFAPASSLVPRSTSASPAPWTTNGPRGPYEAPGSQQRPPAGPSSGSFHGQQPGLRPGVAPGQAMLPAPRFHNAAWPHATGPPAPDLHPQQPFRSWASFDGLPGAGGDAGEGSALPAAAPSGTSFSDSALPYGPGPGQHTAHAGWAPTAMQPSSSCAATPYQPRQYGVPHPQQQHYGAHPQQQARAEGPSVAGSCSSTPGMWSAGRGGYGRTAQQLSRCSTPHHQAWESGNASSYQASPCVSPGELGPPLHSANLQQHWPAQQPQQRWQEPQPGPGPQPWQEPQHSRGPSLGPPQPQQRQSAASLSGAQHQPLTWAAAQPHNLQSLATTAYSGKPSAAHGGPPAPLPPPYHAGSVMPYPQGAASEGPPARQAAPKGNSLYTHGAHGSACGGGSSTSCIGVVTAPGAGAPQPWEGGPPPGAEPMELVPAGRKRVLTSDRAREAADRKRQQTAPSTALAAHKQPKRPGPKAGAVGTGGGLAARQIEAEGWEVEANSDDDDFV